MASTSSLAISCKTSYDVFLSFRGIETRHIFACHLHAALCRKNITTFIDDILERGEGISSALEKAIEESKISVVIFSEKYASSRWCLDELVKIIDCQKEMGRKILPIFYHVDPRDVRKQTGKFGEAFGEVKEKFKHSLDTVEKWRTALMEAGNLSGWVSSDSREKSEKYGLVDLRKSFFSELLGIEIRNIEMLSVVPTFIKDSLNRKKVLAVLDDVNDPEQLEALAINDDDCFGLGSRIILVSRDKQVLSSAEEVYEVKGMNYGDARQLLSMKAFKQKHPPVEYMELCERVQTYCKGVPLALKVLGSFLCKRTPEEWESALTKLKRFPDCKITKVLEISYNDLDEMEKKIFLYIACFFNGYGKSYVEDILNGCDFPTHWGIIRLMDRCLVTIVDDKLEMHDLIVEMGQDIARRKGIILCNSNDICDMLTSTNNKANEAVEGLLLNLSEIRWVHLNDSVFSRMPNLRLLKFYGVAQILLNSDVNQII